MVHGALPSLLHTRGLRSADVDAHRQSLLALADVAANEMNHSTLIEEGVLDILRVAFESKQLGVKEHCSFVVSNLCAQMVVGFFRGGGRAGVFLRVFP